MWESSPSVRVFKSELVISQTGTVQLEVVGADRKNRGQNSCMAAFMQQTRLKTSGFCTWDRAALSVCIDWGMRGWREALRKDTWGSWLMASWIRVSSALAARRAKRVLGASGPASPAGQGRDCPALLCPGTASSRVLGTSWGATV